MDFFIDQSKCCGCMLCKNSCPVNAIDISKKKDGALYPKINEKKCISCGKCRDICSFSCDLNNSFIESYAARRKDGELLKKSQSGGVFASLAEYVWEHNGIVYGCAVDEKLNITHIRTENRLDGEKLYGSKYVQSDIDIVYKLIKKDLEDNKLVLFCGTSCQVAAIKKFCSQYNNLITADILCHGVPGKEIFDSYIKIVEKKHKGTVEKIIFRDKKVYGWTGAGESLKINDQWIHQDQFMVLYNTSLVFRESCYECPYKSLEHPGDITIGDLWGVKDVAPEFDDNKGVSLMLVNTKKGEQIIDALNDKLYLKKINVLQCMQEVLRQPVKRPKLKNVFDKIYHIFPHFTLSIAVIIRKIGYKLHL